MMELLSVFDDNGNKIDKSIVRGKHEEMLLPGEHFGVSIIYIENSKGEFLIQKTSKEKGGRYTSTGGHIDYGESPKETIIREVKEELGITLRDDEVVSLGHLLIDVPLRFIFYVKKDIDLKNVVLQKEEVESVSFMSIGKIRKIIDEEKMSVAHAKILEMVLTRKDK